MDFEKVLPVIIKEFENNKVQYALIGGFAMGFFGVLRTTVDLDFLINRQNMNIVERILKKFGYKCVYKTENVSQFVSNLTIFGEIDFIHAFRKISKTMLARALDMKVLDGKVNLKVLIPEDIIGLKVQAIANNPERGTQDMSDIEAIIKHNMDTLDWNLIEEYFLLFSKKKEFMNLKAKYGKNK